MNKIVCKIQPFDLTQTVYIYKDKTIKSIKIPTNNFCEQVVNLTRAEQINFVSFKGHKKYSKGLKDQIKKYEKTHYCSDKIDIEII